MAANITAEVEKLIKHTVEDCGVFLWDVEFVKEGPTRCLRITIDKEEGIDIEDCERVHRAIDPLLDEADPIDVNYNLEVTSPGIERVLRKPEHIAACLGEQVDVSLFAKINDRKNYTGVLASFNAEEKSFVLQTEQGDMTFPLEKVSKMRTKFDF